jgi:hypothetical protein
MIARAQCGGANIFIVKKTWQQMGGKEEDEDEDENEVGNNSRPKRG